MARQAALVEEERELRESTEPTRVSVFLTQWTFWHTFSGLPLKPTNVPRLVYRFWLAETDADNSDDGLPSTSNLASRIA